MGAVLLYLMASQLSAGMQMMIREKAVDGFDGGIVVGFSLMVALLLSFAAEGITFQPNGRVDLKRHLWLSIPS